jgi:hypothetical protein
LSVAGLAAAWLELVALWKGGFMPLPSRGA